MAAGEAETLFVAATLARVEYLNAVFQLRQVIHTELGCQSLSFGPQLFCLHFNLTIICFALEHDVIKFFVLRSSKFFRNRSAIRMIS